MLISIKGLQDLKEKKITSQSNRKENHVNKKVGLENV